MNKKLLLITALSVASLVSASDAERVEKQTLEELLVSCEHMNFKKIAERYEVSLPEKFRELSVAALPWGNLLGVVAPLVPANSSTDGRNAVCHKSNLTPEELRALSDWHLIVGYMSGDNKGHVKFKTTSRV